MKRWIYSISAGIAGAVAGLWFSENFMHARLFLDGIEVDLSDPTAVAWALANPTKAEWLTYLVLGQDMVIMQPGSYWMSAAPIAFAVVLFSIAFLSASLFARQEPEPKNPFLKAPASPDSSKNRKTARLTGEVGSSATSKALEKSTPPEKPSQLEKSGPHEKTSPAGAGEPLAAVNGQRVELNGNTGLEAEESRDVMQDTQRDAVQGTSQEAVQDTQQKVEPEAQQGTAQDSQHKQGPETRREASAETEKGAPPEARPGGESEETVETVEMVDVVQQAQTESPKQQADEAAAQEIRVEEPAPEAAKPPEGDPEILENEVWKTHYDYLDSIRTIFDKLTARGEHMAVDFATRYMVDPKGSDLEAIVAQILEEERQRNRFSQNDDVEAAHVAMMEFSAGAAAEFRRVIRILGEDIDLNSITQKIRQRFPKTEKRSGVDPYQMNESQVITELRGRGFEIIAPAGGPYSVKDDFGSRVTKPFNLLELQEFLKEQRSL